MKTSNHEADTDITNDPLLDSYHVEGPPLREDMKSRRAHTKQTKSKRRHAVQENVVKKAVIEIETAEKLVLSEIENAFMRAQVASHELQKAFAGEVEKLAKKYGIDSAKHVFSSVEKVFKAL